jgi:hypothetical protein
VRSASMPWGSLEYSKRSGPGLRNARAINLRQRATGKCAVSGVHREKLMYPGVTGAYVKSAVSLAPNGDKVTSGVAARLLPACDLARSNSSGNSRHTKVPAPRNAKR